MERTRTADMVDVVINLRGPHDLSKLLDYNFRRVKYRGDKYFYRFDGVLHIYRFIPVSAYYFKITIHPKRRKMLPPSYITFQNISSECNKWVSAVMIPEAELMKMTIKAIEHTAQKLEVLK